MRVAWPIPLLALCTASCLEASADPPPAAAPAAAPAPAPAPVPVPVPVPDPPPAPVTGPLRYPDGALQSPITAEIAAHLREIAARAPENDHIFAKLGDSISDSEAFLDCFAGAHVDLGDREDLADTLRWFRAGRAAGTSPFNRDSLASITGWAARGPIGGHPSALQREVDTIKPRFAVVMYGTNDVDYRRIDQFASDMWKITDELAARGVIPILSTIPPIDHRPVPGARVPLFNRVVRALAEGERLPLIDLHQAMLALPGHGLREDGVHPDNVPSIGACNLTAAGLRHGYPVRNLLTLDALDRTRQALHAEPPDATAPTWDGDGTAAAPLPVDGLPFAHVGDTRTGESQVASYGCDPDRDESGPELHYHLELAARTRLRARVVTRKGVDVDLHLSQGGVCVARANHNIATTLDAGAVDITVDTYVDHDGVAHPGAYMLILEPL